MSQRKKNFFEQVGSKERHEDEFLQLIRKKEKGIIRKRKKKGRRNQEKKRDNLRTATRIKI